MNIRRRSAVLFRLAFCVVLVFSLLITPPSNASAAQITARSLTLQAGVDPILNGGSRAGAIVNHYFQFTLPAVGNPSVGSIKFQYCTVAIGTCTTPAGLSTTSSTYGSETGATGFTLDNSTNGSPFITRSASSITAATPVSYQLLGVTNPSGASCGLTVVANCTFFVRISTYASIDTTGSAIDTGVVAASTSEQITISGQMPESLIFCTGGTVGTNAGIPDCSTATSGSIVFNQLFSPTSTATTSSQMAASTNAGSGYSITVNGPTLTSGSNTITAMSSATTGVHGLSQFGMNLVANTTSTSTPAVGANINPTANGINYRGEAVSPYDTPDTFKFTTGNIVADSANGGVGGTDAQILTVSYIVNVPGSQPAGTYTTTLTYVCTATF
jgi:hypothetical protein